MNKLLIAVVVASEVVALLLFGCREVLDRPALHRDDGW